MILVLKFKSFAANQSMYQSINVTTSLWSNQRWNAPFQRKNSKKKFSPWPPHPPAHRKFLRACFNCAAFISVAHYRALEINFNVMRSTNSRFTYLLTYLLTYFARDSRLSYGENPESLSHLGLVWYRDVTDTKTDGRTDRLTIASTR